MWPVRIVTGEKEVLLFVGLVVYIAPSSVVRALGALIIYYFNYLELEYKYTVKRDTIQLINWLVNYIP